MFSYNKIITSGKLIRFILPNFQQKIIFPWLKLVRIRCHSYPRPEWRSLFLIKLFLAKLERKNWIRQTYHFSSLLLYLMLTSVSLLFPSTVLSSSGPVKLSPTESMTMVIVYSNSLHGKCREKKYMYITLKKTNTNILQTYIGNLTWNLISLLDFFIIHVPLPHLYAKLCVCVAKDDYLIIRKLLSTM